MSGRSGPSGTGLIPPGAERESAEPDVPEPDGSGNPEPDDQADPPPPAPEVDPADDIDSVPPVPSDEGDDDGGGSGEDDEFIDPDQFRQEIIDEVQRRFDRAVSKITRRQGQPAPSGDGGDDDGGGSQPSTPSGRQVDTRSIRSYARSELSAAMEGAGRAERQAVRSILDDVVEHVDWSTVDDEEEYVEDLVSRLANTTRDLIKVGSDRKVAQLRQSGRLPQLQTQPGSTSPATHSASTGMAQGAATAKKRWPTGRRRMTG